MSYNYYTEMMNDVDTAMREELADIADGCNDLDDVVEAIYEALWADDSVTGNGSGSYTFNAYKAAHMVADNYSIVSEVLEEFCPDADTVKEWLSSPETLDVVIRCYMLHDVVYDWVHNHEKTVSAMVDAD